MVKKKLKWWPRYRCSECGKAEWARGGRMRRCPKCGTDGPHVLVKFGFDKIVRKLKIPLEAAKLMELTNPQAELDKLLKTKLIKEINLLTFGLVNTPIVQDETKQIVAYVTYWHTGQVTLCTNLERVGLYLVWVGTAEVCPSQEEALTLFHKYTDPLNPAFSPVQLPPTVQPPLVDNLTWEDVTLKMNPTMALMITDLKTYKLRFRVQGRWAKMRVQLSTVVAEEENHLLPGIFRELAEDWAKKQVNESDSNFRKTGESPTKTC